MPSRPFRASVYEPLEALVSMFVAPDQSMFKAWAVPRTRAAQAAVRSVRFMWVWVSFRPVAESEAAWDEKAPFDVTYEALGMPYQEQRKGQRQVHLLTSRTLGESS